MVAKDVEQARVPRFRSFVQGSGHLRRCVRVAAQRHGMMRRRQSQTRLVIPGRGSQQVVQLVFFMLLDVCCIASPSSIAELRGHLPLNLLTREHMRCSHRSDEPLLFSRRKQQHENLGGPKELKSFSSIPSNLNGECRNYIS